MTPINHVVIVGGGTAGWLTAGLLAAQHSMPDANGTSLRVTVIESDAIHPIGVGEGTWPTMRNTLHRIGISESELIKQAHATYKQASKFQQWHSNETTNAYYHPFSAPQGSASADITPYWLVSEGEDSHYANAVCFQPTLCEQGLAPKVSALSNQGFSANYGYHLDAGKFIELLKCHCINTLGVSHIKDTVTHVNKNDEGITSLVTSSNGEVCGELFVDCTGFNGLLIEKTLGVGLKDASDILFADTALVSQREYASANQPIACHTLSTAQEAGWIWDIGLQHRRGTGYVFASQYQEKSSAEATFSRYLKQTGESENAEFSFREIKFKTGYRNEFWHKNCVAIGLSSGFLEPLEASSLMLIEQSATQLCEQLPGYTEQMSHVANKFNQSLTYKWERTIEFLKLHYVLSKRTDPFWLDNRKACSIPSRLSELMDVWKYRPILDSDFEHTNEVFSAQSYRYILYGMSRYSDLNQYVRTMKLNQFAQKQFELNNTLIAQLTSKLPSHRGLIESVLSSQQR